MIASIIFGGFILCVICGACKELFYNGLSYGLELVITAFLGALIGWLFGGLWAFGAVIGGIYTIFCWVTGRRNVLISWWFYRG